MPNRNDHKTPFEGFAVEQKAALHRRTSFRVGGAAEVLAVPGTTAELTGLLQAARKEGIPVTILGAGTNVLVSDSGVRGLVVALTGLKGNPELLQQKETIRLRARAGNPLPGLTRLATQKGLSGFEWAAGIPGTLGGAVIMNAGSFGSDMAAVTASVEILDLENLTVKTLSRKDLDFSYRRLVLGHAVVLGAELTLIPGDQEKIQKVYDDNLRHKKNTQPVSQASAGCFFKNPSPEKPAGWLIEQAGLKGHVHRGAMVSDIHANFIINCGRATCREILDLADLVAAAVKEKFDIRLEKEVKLIGS